MLRKLIERRSPAKSNFDINIPESLWKPDFNIVEKYQSFASELARLALLGIAGYGFLIAQLPLPKDSSFTMTDFCKIIMRFSGFLMIGIICLGISLALSLLHRFLSTSCLFDQILIFRSLTRLEQSHWTEDEKKNEKIFLDTVRKKQTSVSARSHIVLMGSAILLSVGYIMVVVVFYKVLEHFASL